MNNGIDTASYEKLFETNNVLDEAEFKKQVINYALENLKNVKGIQDDKLNELRKIYENSINDAETLFNEINDLTPEKIEQMLNNKTNDVKEDEKVKINLDNIDEFQNQMGTKNLIKIHYPYPLDEVRIIENHSNQSAKELFEAAKDEDGLVSVNGFVNAMDVSKDFVEKDKIDIKLYNVTDLAKRGEFAKLKEEERQCVIGLVTVIIHQLAENEEDKKRLSAMPVEDVLLRLSKNVFIAPGENIIVLCVPNDPSKDEISAVKKNAAGNYELENLKINSTIKESEGINKQEQEQSLNAQEKASTLIKRRKSLWDKAA